MITGDFDRPVRAATDVPWDRARERRVLDGALASKRRRARRRWALELTAAMAVTFAAGHALSRAPVERRQARPEVAVPAAGLDETPCSRSATTKSKGRPLGGFAGTGGHGGTGGTGHGGSAGTG
jgi:hypothetical protein